MPSPGTVALKVPYGGYAVLEVRRPLGAASLAPQGILKSANGVLHLALELISFALTFHLIIAGDLSNNFLHFALGLLSRALDAILVHHSGLQFLNAVGS